MAKAFFSKYGAAVIKRGGKRVDFAALNPMRGILETEDEELAKHLRDIKASANPHGLSELTPDEYYGLKKKSRNWTPSVHPKQDFRLQSDPYQRRSPAAADAVADDAPKPVRQSGPSLVAASELPDFPE